MRTCLTTKAPGITTHRPNSARINTERIERDSTETIIGTMLRRRLRTCLFAALPGLVAAALCIVGDSTKASTPPSASAAPTQPQDGESLPDKDGIPTPAPTGPVALDAGDWWSTLDGLRVPVSSSPSARPDRPATPFTTPFRRSSKRLSGRPVENDLPVTALAVVAQPVSPHAPPAFSTTTGRG